MDICEMNHHQTSAFAAITTPCEFVQPPATPSTHPQPCRLTGFFARSPVELQFVVRVHYVIPNIGGVRLNNRNCK